MNGTDTPSPRDAKTIGAPAGVTCQPAGGSDADDAGPGRQRLALHPDADGARLRCGARSATIASGSSKATVTAGTICTSRRISPRTASA